MENFSHASYPDSGDSSPNSREIDSENQSWDEPPSTNATANNNGNYKVKLMCSYGGKIQPRSHDNQLAYVGGDSKILAVDRNIKFSAIMVKLSTFGDSEVCFKYQLPGEDLDALITVTNDEDLEHMMLEYDRLHRGSMKPARLRLFLFPVNLLPIASGFGGSEPNSERQWFVDALNAVQVQNLDGVSPPTATVPAANPDFLFGLDKVKLPDSVPAPAAAVVQEVVVKDVTVGSDCGSEDRHVTADPLLSPAEIQRQIQELQRMHIAATQEQGILQRKINESNARSYDTQDHCKLPDKIATAPATGSAPLQMPIPTAYFPEQNLATVAGSAGQPYYGLQRVFQDVYREQQVYNAVPTSVMQPQGGVPEAGTGYVQVAYDGTGRQVYFTVAPCPSMAAVAGGVAALNQEGKVPVNAKAPPPQTSSV
ncbi:hypothetical protein V6N12_041115 [Hibiscus sabdariffa]|uniref:PB1 domain-containing protein n=1 Tax=Hibiscus sabdariffa TaxID=183260 RepID=A0ABR2E5M2_9ROSI